MQELPEKTLKLNADEHKAKKNSTRIYVLQILPKQLMEINSQKPQDIKEKHNN